MATFNPIQAQPACSEFSHLTPKVLFAFDPAVAIENVAVTSKGHLLLTTLYDGGRLYSLDPSDPAPEAKVIATLPSCDGLTGIQEIAPDVFAITGGLLGATGFEGLRSFNVSVADLNAVSVIETASVPNSTMLNGMAKLPNHPTTILAADSFAGEIIRINTITGEADVAIADDLFKPNAAVSIGVNGLKVLGEYLYFTNSGQGIFARMRIDDGGNRIAGAETEILATLPGTPSRQNFYDDFPIRHIEGGKVEAYIATHVNSLHKVVDKEQSLFLGGGNSSLLQVPTSAVYSNDGKKLYAVTGGGQVVEVELR